MKPLYFTTDKGETFRVKVVKSNKRSLVVDLLKGGEVVKQIKVSKKSRKFTYKKEKTND